MQIAVVTVDYNRHVDTYACLDSLLRSIEPAFQIIVVDNGSDEPLNLAQYPTVELIVLDYNHGFAGGFNVGLRRALETDVDAVLVLNNDTLVADNMLALLASQLAEGVGIVAPRIYYAADSCRIWSDGFEVQLLTLEMSHGRRGMLESELSDHAPRSTKYVLGCAMLIQRHVLEAVGLFDERFFAYYEDLDYCLRVNAAGFKIMTIASAHLWHKIASTTGLDDPRRQYLMSYGSVLFFAKHAHWRLPIIGLYRLGSSIKTVIHLITRNRRDLLRAHLSGLKDGLRDSIFAK